MNNFEDKVFNNYDFIIELESFIATQLNTNSYYPNVNQATISLTGIFNKLDTLYLQPFYTFIFLNNSSGNNTNFLEYFDELLFGDQSALPYSQKLKWFRNYRKETSENITTFSPFLFKMVAWSEKTTNDQKIDLFIENKDATVAQAFTLFRNSNASLEFTGTILENITVFINKWQELLEQSLEFLETQHHPIYNANHNWNQLPLSLRRKWKQNSIS